jgi:hypothetical protein
MSSLWLVMLMRAMVSGLGARMGVSTGLPGIDSGSDERFSGVGRLKGAAVVVRGTAGMV